MKGLEERSRAPKKVSNRTSEEVERLIVSEKRQHMMVKGGIRRKLVRDIYEVVNYPDRTQSEIKKNY